jgi:hypothetical protein
MVNYYQSSLPGLTRQSITEKMDARVTSAFTRVFDALCPAHDGSNIAQLGIGSDELSAPS